MIKFSTFLIIYPKEDVEIIKVSGDKADI